MADESQRQRGKGQRQSGAGPSLHSCKEVQGDRPLESFLTGTLQEARQRASCNWQRVRKKAPERKFSGGKVKKTDNSPEARHVQRRGTETRAETHDVWKHLHRGRRAANPEHAPERACAE